MIVVQFSVDVKLQTLVTNCCLRLGMPLFQESAFPPSQLLEVVELSGQINIVLASSFENGA